LIYRSGETLFGRLGGFVRVNLAYGDSHLEIQLPENRRITVIEPTFVDACPNPEEAIRSALLEPIASPPLREFVRPSDRVGIIFSDGTRPVPNRLILPEILSQLSHVGNRITLFNALGTHRSNTLSELQSLLGDDILREYPIVQNNAFDRTTQVDIGRGRQGHSIWLNRELMECDVKILTGFIEPHFFAGFSGGGKAIMPGMAGLETIMANHAPKMISHPCATWGITKGNRLWEEITEVALRAGRTFLVNVALNRNKAITGVFAGDLVQAHAAGCVFVKEKAMAPVPELFDVVLTTNSGYPLDQNLYQSVKGMSAAAEVVKKGGSIIIAAECRDGIPEHGNYGKLLREVESPEALLALVQAPGFQLQDQWQVQIQAQIQAKARIFVHSSGLSAEQIRSALFFPCRDIHQTLDELLSGRDQSVCVIPEGPQTIPYLQSDS
jgi:lactate racemase